MKANFIRELYENEIKSTETALVVQSMADELQGMVEKISNMKIKELAELVQKMKYDGDIEKADSFNESIGQKLDALIQSISEIKSEIDNEVVKLFNGESFDDNNMDEIGGDFEDDFGDFEEFSADDEPTADEEDIDLSGLENELSREEK